MDKNYFVVHYFVSNIFVFNEIISCFLKKKFAYYGKS